MEISSDSEGLEVPKQRLRPYKLYLTPSQGENVALPRTTRWRRNLLFDNMEENTNEESFSSDNMEEEIDIPNNNPDESNILDVLLPGAVDVVIYYCSNTL